MKASIRHRAFAPRSSSPSGPSISSPPSRARSGSPRTSSPSRSSASICWRLSMPKGYFWPVSPSVWRSRRAALPSAWREFFRAAGLEKARIEGSNASNWKLARQKLVPFAVPIAFVLAAVIWHNRAIRHPRVRVRASHHRVARSHREVGPFFLPLPRAKSRHRSREPSVREPRPRSSGQHPRPRALVHDADLSVAALAQAQELYLARASRQRDFGVFSRSFYQNSGWIQFGFSNDFAVFLFAMLATGGYRFGSLFMLLQPGASASTPSARSPSSAAASSASTTRTAPSRPSSSPMRKSPSHRGRASCYENRPARQGGPRNAAVSRFG